MKYNPRNPEHRYMVNSGRAFIDRNGNLDPIPSPDTLDARNYIMSPSVVARIEQRRRNAEILERIQPTTRAISTRPATVRPPINLSQTNNMPARGSPRNPFQTPVSSRLRRTPGSSRDLFTRSSRRFSARRAYNVASPLIDYGINRLPANYRFVAQAAKKSVDNYMNQKKAVVKRSPKFGGVSTGTYAGKFKKPTKTKKAKVETYFLSKGYHTTQEVFGTFSHDHTVYFTHSTYNAGQVGRTITGALLRKLFRKAGINLGGKDQEIPYETISNSSGFRIAFTVQSGPTGAIHTWNYDSANDKTLGIVITQFPEMVNYFVQKLNNDASNVWHNWMPASLALYSYDEIKDSPTVYRLQSFINLENEKMEIAFMSSTVVQNRTAAAGAGTDDKSLDRIDNQPLKGYLYEFKNAEPRMRYLANQATLDVDLARITDYGVKTTTPATLPVDYNEPPVPAKFGNLLKSSEVLLQPGEMKKMTVSMKYTGVFPRLLERLTAARSLQPANEARWVSGSIGRSQMIALEEILRTDSTNPVVITYEREYKCGVNFITRKTAPFTTDFRSDKIE